MRLKFGTYKTEDNMKISTNNIIKDYFNRGMKVINGEVILPSGRTSKQRKHKAGYAYIGE